MDYGFTENGLYSFKKGELFFTKVSFKKIIIMNVSKSIKDELGEENLQKFIKTVLHYIADLEIPIKRGTFIEYRTGMLNVSPIGRNCIIIYLLMPY